MPLPKPTQQQLDNAQAMAANAASAYELAHQKYRAGSLTTKQYKQMEINAVRSQAYLQFLQDRAKETETALS